VKKVKISDWFEINEKEYFWYILQGYTIEDNTEYVVWRFDGKLHRTDGPAIIKADGSQEWWIDNKLHRTDGPAYIRADGSQERWIDGKEYTEDEFNLRIKNDKAYT
jgi:hypothetical protein